MVYGDRLITRADSGRSRCGTPGGRPPFQPFQCLVHVVEDPGIQPARTQRRLRLPIVGRDGRRARNERQFEVLRDGCGVRHGCNRIAQRAMSVRVFVTRLQQRAVHLLAYAKLGKALVGFGELESVAPAEIDPDVLRAFRDAAVGERVHRYTLASRLEPGPSGGEHKGAGPTAVSSATMYIICSSSSYR